MNKEGQGVNRIVHNVDNHFYNVCFFEAMVFILEGAVAMSDGLNFVYEVDDDFCKRKLVLENVLFLFNQSLRNLSSSFTDADRFYFLEILSRENDGA